MIFVTVGTHEQPFNRLIEYIDNLKKYNKIEDEVIIQTGFSTYEPRYCEWKPLFSYSKMNELVREARIVITHGGPASFMMALQFDKIPIVVPRRKEFNEHINDHQLDFCKEVVSRQGNIIQVDDIKQLEEIIVNYDRIAARMDIKKNGNNKKFCDGFSKVVDYLFK